MTTSFPSHCTLQRIESRLKKNQYLSNDCLPNSLDAQVFISLKASNHVPKRQIYPHFYHWYILMRQFADRTLEHWLKSGQSESPDLAITEFLDTFAQKETLSDQKQSQKLQKSQQHDSKFDLNLKTPIQQRKEKCDESLLQQTDQNVQIPLSPSKDKKNSPSRDSVTEYLMSIKVSQSLGRELEHIKKQFDVQNVRVKWIKFSKQEKGLESQFLVWVEFQTSKILCEQLKTTILRYSNVQSIQCKKIRRTQ